jgi:uncharacterized protein YbcI
VSVENQVSRRPDGSLLATISNELVKLHAKCYGRGPTKARTLIVEDVVVCSLREPFTRAERTLLEMGRRDEVHGMRSAFQYELRDEFNAVIEGLTGRRVTAFVSDVHFDPDMAVLVFFLGPAVERAKLSRDGAGPD